MQRREQWAVRRSATAPRPNLHLRHQRARLGLTQEEVAEALSALAWEKNHERVGVDAGMVSKWERGVKQPRQLYRRLLCILYRATEAELGFRPVDGVPGLDDSEGYDVNRREFLQTAARFSAAAALVPLSSLDDCLSGALGNRLDEAALAGYTSIADAQRTMYWTTPARLLLDSSVAHMRLGTELLPDAGIEKRPELGAAVAKSGLLSARLAFFDLGRMDVAERCFGVARHLAEESGAHDLAAAVYGHIAFVPGFAGDLVGADAALDAAHGHARKAPSPRLSSWLHCVEAEVTARAGALERSMLHIRQAEDALGTRGFDPEWIDFYDSWRLGCFTGSVQLVGGTLAGATATLEEALRTLPPTATKQRSILLLDLATAHAPAHPDHAVDLVDQATETLRADWYATAQGRIPAVRAAFRGTRQMAELEEHLAPIAAAAAL